VLIYPELGGDHTRGSYLDHANAPMLTLEEVHFYLNVRVDGSPPTNDASFAALQDTHFTDLPNTLVLSAECDPLSDDGRVYCDAIKQAGGNARWRHEKGLVHGFLRARHSSARAKQSFKAITDQLAEFAKLCKVT